MFPHRFERVLARYPAIGAGRALCRELVGPNSVALLFQSDAGRFCLKGVPAAVRTVTELAAVHALSDHLVAEGFPTPALVENDRGKTVTAEGESLWSLYEAAKGEDRYGCAGVFDPFGSEAELRSAGAVLAQYHRLAHSWPGACRRPFQGMTCQYRLLSEPDPASALLSWLPASARAFLSGWPGFTGALARFVAMRPLVAPYLPELPEGVIHGDLIKRNLFFEGSEVVSVIDLDLWNLAPLSYDLALALQPVGFPWPRLLAGGGAVRREHMRAFLAGYEAVRPLEIAERAALPGLVATCRLEFHVSCAADALARGDSSAAERFLALQAGILAWFEAHPPEEMVLFN